jgi:hypothetical protein
MADGRERLFVAEVVRLQPPKSHDFGYGVRLQPPKSHDFGYGELMADGR